MIPPTRVIGMDANTVVLRSSWDANAFYAAMMCAADYQSGGLASRHNTQNPLDMTLSALGEMLVPLSSGGPQVTSSANRNYYLDPASKNLPLVNGTAPYITNPADITFLNRIDSHDENSLTKRYLDAATLSTIAYNGASAVSRTPRYDGRELCHCSR